MHNQIIEVVENTLKTLGLEPQTAKVAEGQYNISKDQKIEIMIDVWEENERIFFQALSPVNELNDVTRVEVLQMLLEENHGLVEASFSLAQNTIIVKTTIECSAFFNQERALSTITRIAFYSEFYKNKWQQTAI